MTPQKVNNPTIKDLNYSEVGKISNIEFKKNDMIKEIEQDMYKHLNEFKENINDQLNVIKTMQEMKEKNNKYIEILKKINLRYWN
jgi:uncharacterized Fe-S cluster-containing protein